MWSLSTRHNWAGSSLVVVALVTMILGGCRSETAREAVPEAPPVEEVSPAEPERPAVTDANIAALVDEVNVADSTLAALALPKLTDDEVKGFARQMMTQHHQLHQEGERIAMQQNITPQLPSPDPFAPAVAAARESLSSLAAGPAFDSTYIANEVVIHRAVLDWLSQADHQPQNPAYRKYLEEATPVLQQHLREAEALQSKLSEKTTR